MGAVDYGVEVGVFDGFVGACSCGSVIHGLHSGGGEERGIHPVSDSRFFRCAAINFCNGFANALGDAGVTRADEWRAVEQEAD